LGIAELVKSLAVGWVDAECFGEGGVGVIDATLVEIASTLEEAGDDVLGAEAEDIGGGGDGEGELAGGEFEAGAGGEGGDVFRGEGEGFGEGIVGVAEVLGEEEGAGEGGVGDGVGGEGSEGLAEIGDDGGELGGFGGVEQEGGAVWEERGVVGLSFEERFGESEGFGAAALGGEDDEEAFIGIRGGGGFEGSGGAVEIAGAEVKFAEGKRGEFFGIGGRLLTGGLGEQEVFGGDFVGG
jgi:hypothetical protein